MLLDLFKWLLSLFNGFNKRPQVQPPERVLVTEKGVLWRVYADEPGVTGQYKLVDSRIKGDLVISMLSISMYREDSSRMYHYKRDTDPLNTRPNKVESDLEVFCNAYNKKQQFMTHVFYVAFRSRVQAGGLTYSSKRKARRSRAQRRFIVSPVCVIPCDLQGVRMNVGDRCANQLCLSIAKYVAQLDELSVSMIQGVDWHELVRGGAKKVLGNSHEI